MTSRNGSEIKLSNADTFTLKMRQSSTHAGEGQSLISECQGSQPAPYRVEIRLGTEGILDGSCTCPAGEGGHCKHSAALLLTWIHDPESFIEVPELEQVLEERSKEDLISLIREMVTRHPDLEQLLELSALSNLSAREILQPDLIGQQIRRAFSSAGGEQGDNARIAENLQTILDLGEDLLDREDVRNAATVYETLMEGMLVLRRLPLPGPERRPGPGAGRVRAGYSGLPGQHA